MVNLLFFLGSIFAGAAVLTNYCGQFLRASEEKKLADVLTDGWYRASTTPAIVFVRKPIGLLRRGFDAAFGKSVFSKKAFFRAAFLGNILFIAAVSASGFFSGDKVAALSAWDLGDFNKKVAQQQEKTTAQQKVIVPMQAQFFAYFDEAHGFWWKCLFSTYFWIATVMTNGLVYFACTAIVRLLLRELELAQGFLTFFIALIFSLFVNMGLLIVDVGVIILISLPVVWPTVIALIRAGPVATFIGSFLVFVLIFVLALAIGGVSLRICLCIALFPTLIVTISLLWAVIAFPFKKYIHLAIEQMLLRTAESKRNAFAFFSLVLAGISGLLVFTAKYLL